MEKVGITDLCGLVCCTAIAEDLRSLEYDAMLVGKWLQAFQRSFLSPFLGLVPFSFA